MGKVKFHDQSEETFDLISEKGNFDKDSLVNLDLIKDFLDLPALAEEIKNISLSDDRLIEIGFFVTLRFLDKKSMKPTRTDKNVELIRRQARMGDLGV